MFCPQAYLTVRIDRGAPDPVYIQYALTTDTLGLSTPPAAGRAPTASEIVAAARALVTEHPGIPNANDCGWIAMVVAAAAGATLTDASQSLVPTENLEGGYWRIAHRGTTTAVANWLSLTRPGDIVRFDWADPSQPQHTTLITGAQQGDGSVTVVDNSGTIREHAAWYDQQSVAASVTIYRVTTDNLYLIETTDAPEVVLGTVNGDLIRAGGGDDSVPAGSGDDVVIAAGGNDTLNGGSGNDSLSADDGEDVTLATHDDGNDTISGGNGFDILDYSGVLGPVQINQLAGTTTGSAGNDVLLDVIEQIVGTNFDDVLSGGHGINVLDGNGGNDQFFGNNGDDLMRGGAGNDTFHFSTNDGNDTLIGGAGFDVLDYSSLQGVVQINQLDGYTTGTANNDTLGDVFEMVIGTAFGDVLSGGHGINSLKGGGGNDQIFANNGDDYVSGGTGNDTITLGLGNDVLDFRNGENVDTITDITAGGTDDRVDLRFYSGLGITTFAQLQASGRLSTVSGHAELDLNGGDRIIFQNVTSHTLLTAADFVLS